jgi:hypothetical protein
MAPQTKHPASAPSKSTGSKTLGKRFQQVEESKVDTQEFKSSREEITEHQSPQHKRPRKLQEGEQIDSLAVVGQQDQKKAEPRKNLALGHDRLLDVSWPSSMDFDRDSQLSPVPKMVAHMARKFQEEVSSSGGEEVPAYRQGQWLTRLKDNSLKQPQIGGKSTSWYQPHRQVDDRMKPYQVGLEIEGQDVANVRKAEGIFKDLLYDKGCKPTKLTPHLLEDEHYRQILPEIKAVLLRLAEETSTSSQNFKRLCNVKTALSGVCKNLVNTMRTAGEKKKYRAAAAEHGWSEAEVDAGFPLGLVHPFV